MQPVYIDVHIHTSENPAKLNQSYAVDVLFSRIREKAQGQKSLISFTDHNTINKKVYLDAISKCGDDICLLLGTELHIHYVKETEAYHCHIFFKNSIEEDSIDKINTILDKLYPQKQVEKTDQTIPILNEIIDAFDEYDFVLLPHGGQSHATFDKAIPKGRKFDTMMEKSIYYNQFDGFTARSENGREETDQYFNKLGISEFVNLVTCSDNYNPRLYPNAKAEDAAPFVPTWMFASPTFDGFRLSLSERSRFYYGENKPDSWCEKIESVKCVSEKLDIDIEFSSGLNVVIGGSSSGKTLLVDSVYKSLAQKGFQDSCYKEYGVDGICVVNPSNMQPHYLHQNYIMQIVNPSDDNKLENIDIIKSLFPDNKESVKVVQESLSDLHNSISRLIQIVQDIEKIEGKLKSTSQIGHLLVLSAVKKNIFQGILPHERQRGNIKYAENKYQTHLSTLEEIKMFLSSNPLIEQKYDEIIEDIKKCLGKAKSYSDIENSIYGIIDGTYKSYDESLRSENIEAQTKTQTFNALIDDIKKYAELSTEFKTILDTIAKKDISVDTKEVKSAGHTLYISNTFTLNQAMILEAFNGLLKTNCKINNFSDISPQKLYASNFSKQKPKVADYDDFEKKVYDKFVESNKITYKITTKEGKDFDSLSAGWKTSVLLDLILCYEQDIAPIIIDQPEDNLATKYINDGLVEAIKKTKKKKQIILVSHNATIPMMGDAQTLVYCVNDNGKIKIRSSLLEGKIGDRTALDLIASITDGGKSSVKKRVKKYNLKKYTE